MKKIVLLFYLLLTLPGLTSAQYMVKGVVSEKNNQVISFAAVVLHMAKDSSVVKGAVTDESGAFQISINTEGVYFISIQYVGFQKMNTQTFTFNNQNSSTNLGKLILEEDVQTLSEVTVTAQKPLVEQQPDRIVLNVENSVITKGNKVNDLLKYAPLVNVDHEGSIKVANNGSVLILVDGRQMGDAALKSFLQNFSAEDILKVEVVTNPSARYDASYKSVINIITKKSLEIGLNGRVSLNYSQGKYSRFTPDASLNYRSPKWNIFGGTSYDLSSYYYEQHLERFFPDGSMDNDLETINRFNRLSTFMGIDFSPNDQHILGVRLNGNLSESNGEAITLTSFFNPANRLDSLLRTDNIEESGNQTYDINFNYTGKFDSTGKELVVNITQTLYDKHGLQDVSYRQVSLEEELINEPTILRISNPSKQNSFIVQADYTLPTPKARWEFGVKYIQISNNNALRQENFINNSYQFDPALSNEDIYREQTYATYTNYSSTLKNNWNVQAGLRAEQTDQALTNTDISRNYFGFFPSAGINKKLNRGYSWGITYSRKINRPSLGSLVPYRYMLDPYSFAEGNPELKPQYSNTFNAYLNIGWISFFANYALNRNMIAPILYGDVETKIYTQITGNLDRVHGAYIGANWSDEVTKWWQTNTTVTLSGTLINSPVANMPEFNVNGYGINFRSTNIFTLPYNWKAEFMLNYNSPNRWMAWETGAQYWVTTSINKEFWERANLRIQFQDIFRTQNYRIWAKYGTVDLYSMGYNDNQRVYVSFSYNFGKKTIKGARQRKLGNEDTKSRIGE